MYRLPTTVSAPSQHTRSTTPSEPPSSAVKVCASAVTAPAIISSTPAAIMLFIRSSLVSHCASTRRGFCRMGAARSSLPVPTGVASGRR